MAAVWAGHISVLQFVKLHQSLCQDIINPSPILCCQCIEDNLYTGDTEVYVMWKCTYRMLSLLPKGKKKQNVVTCIIIHMLRDNIVDLKTQTKHHSVIYAKQVWSLNDWTGNKNCCLWFGCGNMSVRCTTRTCMPCVIQSQTNQSWGHVRYKYFKACAVMRMAGHACVETKAFLSPPLQKQEWQQQHFWVPPHLMALTNAHHTWTWGWYLYWYTSLEVETVREETRE